MSRNNLNNKGFVKIENSISEVLKPIFTKKKDNFLAINNLNKNWQNIVGEKCWQSCFPKKITFEKNKKNNGVLTISASNASIAFYLEANTSQIIQNIASYYGYKIVDAIRVISEPRVTEEIKKKDVIEVSPERQNFINKSTAIVKDDELRSILQKLGKSI